ncbi:hypothetical protein [Nitrosomonas sp. wSCUT-2]
MVAETLNKLRSEVMRPEAERAELAHALVKSFDAPNFDNAFKSALDLLEDEVVPLTNLSSATGVSEIKRPMLRRFPYDIAVRDFR